MLRIRVVTALVALVHLWPATKHIGAWLAAPSWFDAWSDAWRGAGAAFAAVLLLLPLRWRTRMVSFMRHRGAFVAIAATLVAVHVVPLSEHGPRFVASASWGDGWRALGASIAVVWFARHLVARRRTWAAALAGVAAFALSCASAPRGFEVDGGAAPDVHDDGGPGPFGADGGPIGDAPSAGPTLLYAHTDTTLFSFDPSDLGAPPRVVGMFDCIGGGGGSAPSMTDIGVTKDGKLFGVSEVAAYPLALQAGKVHCEATWPLPANAQFYGLTVAPENTVAASEVLIAANSAGQLFQVDATSGTPTQVGTLGADPASGKPWSLSGDIVFLANGGSPIGFATVRTCTGVGGTTCSSVDTLVEVDVKAVKPGKQSVLKAVRGQVVKGAWCKNPASPSTFGSMFGVAALHDKVYGFSRKGDIVEISNDDGSGCLVAAYTADHFAGAGVTTTAPIQAPPPK